MAGQLTNNLTFHFDMNDYDCFLFYFFLFFRIWALSFRYKLQRKYQVLSQRLEGQTIWRLYQYHSIREELSGMKYLFGRIFPPFHARLGPLLSLTTTPIWAWKEIIVAPMITRGPGKDRWIITFIPIYLGNESELYESDGNSEFINCEFKFQVLHNRSRRKVGRLPGSYLQRRWGKLLS